MKKHFATILGLLLLVTQSFYAQTQSGYVKTLGRPEKKGEALSGVTIRVKGEHNSILSQADGTFSMTLPGLKNGDAYTLQTVQKYGYELNETDIVGRQFAFSDKVPLTIVMVSTAQLQADKQRIENNAYKTAEKNYKAKAAQIEKQLQDSVISLQQYREGLLDLQEKFEKYQSLIEGLAEHYAHTDYDLLDEKDREINLCIENGELERADSLIRLLFDPIGVLERNMEALSKLDMQIAQANDIIAQANEDMTAVLKQQEKDAEYLYQLYTIALSRYDNEKARLYIETRAALDTTNVEWQNEAGKYFDNYLGYHDQAHNYYQRGLRQSLVSYGKYNYWTVLFHNNLGSNYASMNNYGKAIEQLETALDIETELDSILYFTAIAATYNNLGFINAQLGSYTLAIEYYEKALAIQQHYYGDNCTDLVYSHNNIGSAYLRQGDFSKAIDQLIEAMTIQEKLIGIYHPVSAAIYNNLGFLYSYQGDYQKAIEFHKKALLVRKTIYGEYHYLVGASYFNTAIQYEKTNDYKRAIEYHENALETLKLGLSTDSHMDLASSYNHIGDLYYKLHDYSRALENYRNALTIYLNLNNQDGIALAYGSIGAVFDNLEEYNQAIDYYQKGMAVTQLLYDDNHPQNITFQKAIAVAKYRLALTNGTLSEFCEEHCFTASIIEGNTPASLQGLSGEYVLLEFSDWKEDDMISLFDKNDQLRGKPKDILILKNGIISKHHFENSIGAQLGIKHVSKEEKRSINKAYKEWKTKNRP